MGVDGGAEGADDFRTAHEGDPIGLFRYGIFRLIGYPDLSGRDRSGSMRPSRFLRSIRSVRSVRSSVASDQGVGLRRDLQFLVGGDHGDRDPRTRGRDQPRLAAPYGVQPGVDREAQLLQARDRRLAHRRRVLAHPRRERDRVHPAEHRVVGADVLPQPVDVDVEGQLRLRVALVDAAADLPHVVVAAQTEQAAPLVEQSVDLVRGHPADPRQMEDDGRVQVTGPGTHHQSLQRCQAHGGVHAPPARVRPTRTRRCPGAARSR